MHKHYEPAACPQCGKVDRVSGPKDGKLWCQRCNYSFTPPADLFGQAPPALPPPPPPPEHDGRARHTDPDTSHEAAAKARTGRVDLLILGVLVESVVLVAYWQAAQMTGEREVVVSPRFRPLEKMGCIERVRKEINPGTRAKCWAWRITEHGRAVLKANRA